MDLGGVTYLETLTFEFWQLSSLCRGRIDDTITVGKAIDETSRISNLLGPHRRLRYYVGELSDALIVGIRRKKKKKPVTNIIPFQQQTRTKSYGKSKVAKAEAASSTSSPVITIGATG